MIRADLPLGTLAAQLVHAAGETSPGGLDPGTFAVVLAARDLAHLEAIERELQARAIPHHAVREPDPPWRGQLMAIGFTPTRDRAALAPVLGRLPLLK